MSMKNSDTIGNRWCSALTTAPPRAPTIYGTNIKLLLSVLLNNAGFLLRLCSVSNAYLLTPWSRVLLEKLTGLQIVKNFPAFYGTRRFIAAFTSAHHLFLSWASSIHSTPPHPTSWRSILILSSHLRLSVPNDLFPSGFPTNTLFKPLLSPYVASVIDGKNEYGLLVKWPWDQECGCS
jgi:hypothetical protein